MPPPATPVTSCCTSLLFVFFHLILNSGSLLQEFFQIIVHCNFSLIRLLRVVYWKLNRFGVRYGIKFLLQHFWDFLLFNPIDR